MVKDLTTPEGQRTGEMRHSQNPVYPGCTYKNPSACALAGVTVASIKAKDVENARLTERVKVLESALKPFVEFWSLFSQTDLQYKELDPDDDCIVINNAHTDDWLRTECLTVGDFKRARTTLTHGGGK